ncbi:MAG: acetolactate decarboxylase [Deltaproteobacteria bacterium]|nr:acetolactate decarboxylase [Deltaproteobacteria bacterium]
MKTITPQRSLFISCPVEALMQGLYQAPTSMTSLKTHGDFGLGTFNGLDGEMIVLDGVVYRAEASGRIRPVDDAVETPFACVTFFAPDTTEEPESPVNRERFWNFLRGLIPSPNMAYAVLIRGEFDLIHARSVPAQQQGRPLVEAARNQVEFTFTDTRGSLVGFYTPEFIKSLVVPGFHLHFLNHDHTVGGHLLHCALGRVEIGLMHIPEISVALPMTLDYLTADLSPDVQKDLHQAER